MGEPVSSAEQAEGGATPEAPGYQEYRDEIVRVFAVDSWNPRVWYDLGYRGGGSGGFTG